jgi:hypothetical protein
LCVDYMHTECIFMQLPSQTMQNHGISVASSVGGDRDEAGGFRSKARLGGRCSRICLLPLFLSSYIRNPVGKPRDEGEADA